MSVKGLLVLAFVIVGAQTSSIPDYIHVCKRNDPQLSRCIINSITSLLPRLKAGIPELNVPSLEPLLLPGSPLLDTKSGATHLKVNLSNLEVRGGSEFTILELTPKLQTNQFHFKVKYPKINIEGDYEIDSKILALQLRGQGRIHLNVTDLEHESTLKGKVSTKNGRKHLKFEKMNSKISFGAGRIWLDNLFNGDPALGKGANDAINDNISAFFEELKPSFERAINNRFTQIANKITEKFDYDDLFP